MDERLLSYLDAIDPGGLTYAEWVQVGMALKHEGGNVGTWDEWSRKDPSRYNAGECERKWKGFNEASGGEPVTGGTLYQMALDRGWEPPAGEAVLYDFGDEMTLDEFGEEPQGGRKPARNPSQVEFTGGEVRGGLTGLPAAEQAKIYIETLFSPSEFVGFTVRAKKDERRGKWVPDGQGVNALSADLLLRDISKCKGDLSSVFGTTGEGGAWVRINALDGKGIRNANVINFKYALVESDTLPMAKQWELYQRLNLPCAAIVSSGGKSIHAIVRVDARDIKDYYNRVDKLYSILRGEGVEIDNQNRNPSRLSRLPGILRGGRMQSLIAVKTGAKDWESWLKYVEEEIEKDDLGDFENCLGMAPPVLKDELIPGILRKGHKMLIAGPSKAGKSFLLLELAVCIAGGLPWLGLPVKKGRVLYVNLEIDPESFKARVFEMLKARKLENKDSANLDIWNLRGKASPLDKLVPKLIRRARNQEYAAVIIDPIYKILTGDENSASEMGAFTNQFDRICAALGCAVIYCHHHSKGAQGGKRAIDRASGSGVFARDPDALLDIMEIEKKPRDDARLREIGANAALVAGMRRRGFVAKKTDGSAWEDAPENVYESQARCVIAEFYGSCAANTQRADYPETLARAWEAWTEAEGRRESGSFITDAADRYERFTAWILEASTREFAPPRPRWLWFSYPLHLAVDPKAGDELTQAFLDMANGRRRKAPAAGAAPEEKKTPMEEKAEAAISALQMEAASRKLDGQEDAETFTREEILDIVNRSLDKPISKNTFIKWTVPGHEKSNIHLMRYLDLVENTAGKPTRYRLREEPRTLEEMKDFTLDDFQCKD